MCKWLAVIIVLAGWAAAISGVMAQEKENLCINGDFEKEPGYIFPGTDKNMDRFVKEGWDLGEGMYLKVADWTYNIGGSAAVRIIEGEAGKEVHSGKRCLMLKTANAQIYNTQKKKAGEYSFSLYARGKGKVGVVIYEYSQGGQVFLKSRAVLEAVPVSEEWKKYAGTIKTQGHEAEFFAFALVALGEVYIDDVVLYSEEKLHAFSE